MKFATIGRRLRRGMSAWMLAALLAGLFSGLLPHTAHAATSRIAKVISVTGDVTVRMAGGDQPFPAFAGLTLNQGDRITTGGQSSAVLEVVDHKDEITIGSGAEIYVSSLRDQGQNRQTKLQIMAGSLWAKVSKLVNGDQFEVDTPTAVMGVRGTNFFTSVDGQTGRTLATVGSGFIQVHDKNPSANRPDNAGTGAPGQPSPPVPNGGNASQSPGRQDYFVYPTQQIDLVPNIQNHSTNVYESILDMNQFVKNADPAILTAIIRNKPAIDQENAQLLQTLKQEAANGRLHQDPLADSLDLNGSTDLSRIQDNLDHFVDNAAKDAVVQKKLQQSEIDQVVQQLDQRLGQNIQLDPNVTGNLQVDENQAKKQSTSLSDMASQLAALLNQLNNQENRHQATEKKIEQQQQQKHPNPNPNPNNHSGNNSNGNGNNGNGNGGSTGSSGGSGDTGGSSVPILSDAASVSYVNTPEAVANARFEEYHSISLGAYALVTVTNPPSDAATYTIRGTDDTTPDVSPLQSGEEVYKIGDQKEISDVQTNYLQVVFFNSDEQAVGYTLADGILKQSEATSLTEAQIEQAYTPSQSVVSDVYDKLTVTGPLTANLPSGMTVNDSTANGTATITWMDNNIENYDSDGFRVIDSDGTLYPSATSDRTVNLWAEISSGSDMVLKSFGNITVPKVQEALTDPIQSEQVSDSSTSNPQLTLYNFSPDYAYKVILFDNKLPAAVYTVDGTDSLTIPNGKTSLEPGQTYDFLIQKYALDDTNFTKILAAGTVTAQTLDSSAPSVSHSSVTSTVYGPLTTVTANVYDGNGDPLEGLSQSEFSLELLNSSGSVSTGAVTVENFNETAPGQYRMDIADITNETGDTNGQLVLNYNGINFNLGGLFPVEHTASVGSDEIAVNLPTDTANPSSNYTVYVNGNERVCYMSDNQPCLLTDLTANTSYSIEVKEFDASNQLIGDWAYLATTAGMRISGSNGSYVMLGEANVNWTSVDGAANYKVVDLTDNTSSDSLSSTATQYTMDFINDNVDTGDPLRMLRIEAYDSNNKLIAASLVTLTAQILGV